MYKIQVFKQAVKYYSKLDTKTQRKINNAIETITKNPIEGFHIKKLKGELEGKYRYNVGGLRIIYFVDTKERIISIEAIGSRGDIYK
jgi:mRNA interferase RelE/StbE